MAQVVLSKTLLSLRGKVMLIVVAGMAVVFAVLAVFVYYTEQNLIERQFVRSYSETAASFGALIRHSIYKRDLRMLQAMADLKAVEPNLRFVVVRDARGNIVVRAGEWEPGGVLSGRPTAAEEAPSPDHATVLDVRDHLLEVEATIPGVEPAGDWRVELGVDTEQAENEVAANARRIVLLSGVMLVISLATMLFIDRRLRKILRDLIGVTRRMADGDRALRVDIRTGDELQVLGESFNAMSAALQEQQEEIRSHAETLEARVRARTQALAAEKQKLSVILGAIRAGLILYDARAKAVWHNDVARAWLAGEHALSTAMRLELFEGRGGVESVARQSLAERVAVETEKTVVDDAGDTHFFQVLATPIRGEPPDRLQALLLLMDVSEKRRLEQELQHASKMAAIGELAGGVAHEVNTPVGVVIAKAEFLLERLETRLEHKDVTDLRAILRNAQRIADIARGFLSFSRKAAARRKDVALNPLVRETVETLTEGLERTGLRVETRLAPELPIVLANSDEIEEILSNLITNALDSMRDSRRARRLEVSTAADATHVTIQVRDSGCGIAPAMKERVFEPFFSTKTVGHGTGLGLSISLGIVKAHGGEITVESARDRGSTFTVRLPVATEAIGTHGTS